jgi:hypothetical protein
MDVMTGHQGPQAEVHMSIQPVGAVPVQQAQTDAQHTQQAADGDGDNDGSPPAGSLPQGSTTSTYA